ncbi:hypothetical protein [Dietzia sp. B32]|uniref:hypothetical protein n=1 Tax=Dietzia sp. B32 TaxID=2915130 RepID=UPI0021AE1844|nr:hypothetical protein [Dietzia sp. B32]UVE95629.1 hypothetical protein L8M95_02155 [Dietzia sp. B32]
MDPRQDPESRVDTGANDDSGPDAVTDGAARSNQEPGQSSADVITMSLFGAMVVIASICFVIW